MTNDENHAGERDTNTMNSDQQEDRRNTHEGDEEKGKLKTGDRQEAQKEEQFIRNDKKETTRGKRGREEWGGYQGY